MSVVVVGASLGGLRTVQALRRRGYDEPITLIGDESVPPYDRPPLSKDFLTGPAASPPFLATDDEFARLGVEVHLGSRATRLDPQRRRVELAGGEVLEYGTAVVLATGAVPRSLMAPGNDLTGIHRLRTLDDATALRSALDRSPRVVVVGGGFIGAEVASAARVRGLQVTMVERAATPFALSLGEQVGTSLSRLHQDSGVCVRTQVSVLEAHGNDRVEALTLTDGTRLDCDLALVGVGVAPATTWLQDAGIALSDGVMCDSRLRSVSAPDVYAVGDVASWPHPLLGRRVRIEHWTNATEHAEVVAGGILGQESTAGSVPYVWSDQFGCRIQVIGRPGPHDRVRLVTAPGADRLSAALWSHDRHLTSVLSVDAPRIIVRARKAIQRQDTAEEFLREQFDDLA